MNAPFEYDRARAMKQTDFSPCVSCGRGVMHNGLPIFYRLTIERMGADMRAINRQAGLEQFLGGSAKLANVMGPNEDMGLPIGPALRGLLCETCANGNTCLTVAAEVISERQKETGG